MSAFTTIKIRVAAAVTYRGRVALIQRTRDTAGQYTVPGGNVEHREPIPAALRRELREELCLDLDADTPLRLLAVQDQMVSRPGDTPPPRKLHLLFHVPVTDAQYASMGGTQYDDGSFGQVVLVGLADVAGLHVYPDVAASLTALRDTETSAAMLLPAMTDDTYTWR